MSLEADIRRDTYPTPTRFLLECGAFTPGFGLNLDNYNPFDTRLKSLNTGTPKPELNPFDTSFRTPFNTISAMNNGTKSALQNIQQENEKHHSLERHPWTDTMFDEATMPMPQMSPSLSPSSSHSRASPSPPIQSPFPRTVSLNQFHSSMAIEPQATQAHTYATKMVYPGEPDVEYFSYDSPTSRETFTSGGTLTKNACNVDNCHYDNDEDEDEDVEEREYDNEEREYDNEEREYDNEERDADHDQELIDRHNDSGVDTAMSALDTRRFSAMSDIQSTAFDRESNAGECGMDKKAKATKTAKEKKSKKEAPSATAGPAKAISDSRKTKGAATKRGRTSSSPKESSEVKRQKFLERNRMAASKCREKKRLQTLKTISDADEITARNQALHETLDQLQEEVWRLKNQILCHRNCGCDVIQKFVQSSFDYNAPPAPSFAVPASVVQMQLY